MKLNGQLGLVDFEKANYENLVWGGIADGTKVAKGMPIFPRIEVEKEDLKAEVKSERKFNVKKTENDTSVPLITMDDFLKTELRVAEILTAEKIEKSEKLIKLTVSLGEEIRTVVSGIAKYYKPEELVGKHVIFVANLKPAKLMGIESQGMVLAASKDNDLVLPFVDMPAGSRVK